MKNLNLTTLIAVCAVLLNACGGGDSAGPTPNSTESPIPTPIIIAKKTINVDNLEQVFASYLLYRYRLTKEIDLLSQASRIISRNPPSAGQLGSCPLSGNYDGFNPVTFHNCYFDQGVLISGSTKWNPTYGPTRANWYDLIDLNYQLNDDTEVLQLSGVYHPLTLDLFGNLELRRFNVKYSRGTRTETYTNYAERSGIVAIATFDGLVKQDFTLTEYNDKNLPITPVVSAADGSNISIEFSSIGSANLSLRNDKDVTAHATKSFTQVEVEKLLAKERRSKT